MINKTIFLPICCFLTLLICNLETYLFLSFLLCAIPPSTITAHTNCSLKQMKKKWWKMIYKNTFLGSEKGSDLSSFTHFLFYSSFLIYIAMFIEHLLCTKSFLLLSMDIIFLSEYAWFLWYDQKLPKSLPFS